MGRLGVEPHRWYQSSQVGLAFVNGDQDDSNETEEGCPDGQASHLKLAPCLL